MVSVVYKAMAIIAAVAFAITAISTVMTVGVGIYLYSIYSRGGVDARVADIAKYLDVVEEHIYDDFRTVCRVGEIALIKYIFDITENMLERFGVVGSSIANFLNVCENSKIPSIMSAATTALSFAQNKQINVISQISY